MSIRCLFSWCRRIDRFDGVDASAFMLGKCNTTGRDSYMFFGDDGELMSIKWKFYKTVFRYTIDRITDGERSVKLIGKVAVKD